MVSFWCTCQTLQTTVSTNFINYLHYFVEENSGASAVAAVANIVVNVGCYRNSAENEPDS